MSGIAVGAPPKENENTLVHEIPLDRNHPPAANPRGGVDSAALANLAESIKARGVLESAGDKSSRICFFLLFHLLRVGF